MKPINQTINQSTKLHNRNIITHFNHLEIVNAYTPHIHTHTHTVYTHTLYTHTHTHANRQTHTHTEYTHTHTHRVHTCTHTPTDRQTDRRTDRQTDRQTGTHARTHTHTHQQTFTHACIHKYITHHWSQLISLECLREKNSSWTDFWISLATSIPGRPSGSRTCVY